MWMSILNVLWNIYESTYVPRISLFVLFLAGMITKNTLRHTKSVRRRNAICETCLFIRERIFPLKMMALKTQSVLRPHQNSPVVCVCALCFFLVCTLQWPSLCFHCAEFRIRVFNLHNSHSKYKMTSVTQNDIWKTGMQTIY